jgi:hypothetical protein
MARHYNAMSPQQQAIWAATYALEFQRTTPWHVPRPGVGRARWAHRAADMAVDAFKELCDAEFEAKMAKEPKP